MSVIGELFEAADADDDGHLKRVRRVAKNERVPALLSTEQVELRAHLRRIVAAKRGLVDE